MEITELTKQIIAEASEQPNPALLQEEELLCIIRKITDDETANKARDSYHSKYHIYTFDTYLSLLSELCDHLSSGMTINDAFKLIDIRIRQICRKNSDFPILGIRSYMLDSQQ